MYLPAISDTSFAWNNAVGFGFFFSFYCDRLDDLHFFYILWNSNGFMSQMGQIPISVQFDIFNVIRT